MAIYANLLGGEQMDTPNFILIKNNFDTKKWTAEQVQLAVAQGQITTDQYQNITGNEYPTNTHDMHILTDAEYKQLIGDTVDDI